MAATPELPAVCPSCCQEPGSQKGSWWRPRCWRCGAKVPVRSAAVGFGFGWELLTVSSLGTLFWMLHADPPWLPFTVQYFLGATMIALSVWHYRRGGGWPAALHVGYGLLVLAGGAWGLFMVMRR